jgi:hypothetical protein
MVLDETDLGIPLAVNRVKTEVVDNNNWRPLNNRTGLVTSRFNNDSKEWRAPVPLKQNPQAQKPNGVGGQGADSHWNGDLVAGAVTVASAHGREEVFD